VFKTQEAFNKLIIKQDFCASSWLITKIKLEKVSHAAHESPFVKLTTATDATHKCMVAMEAKITAQTVHCVGGVEQKMKLWPTSFGFTQTCVSGLLLL